MGSGLPDNLEGFLSMFALRIEILEYMRNSAILTLVPAHRGNAVPVRAETFQPLTISSANNRGVGEGTDGVLRRVLCHFLAF